MLSSIANFKENLNKIALDVHDDDDDDDDDDDEELSIYSSSRDRDSDRRNSVNSYHSRSPTPTANGFGSSHNFEIEQYKAEINRLQNSEAEIKALSVNHAALLREKEDHISRLNEENGMLKQNLHTENAALSVSRSMIKELTDLLEEKNKALETRQASHEAEMKQLRIELDRERDILSNMRSRLEEEQKSNASLRQEFNALKVVKNKLSSEMAKVHDELNERIAEIRGLQTELQRRDKDEADERVDSLKKAIEVLEKENINLKNKKYELATALQATKDASAQGNLPSRMNEKVPALEGFSGEEEMKQSMAKLEKELKEACRQRDKAKQELNRLKQHLLEKESEEAEKMDEDIKVIEELRAQNDYHKVQISHLENALNQAIASQKELKQLNESELKKSKEVIDELNRKVANSMSTIQKKNVEVLNLQTALGQYYAEIEAKEHLAEDLYAAKEELARLSECLKEAYQQAETLNGEKEELVNKLSKAERAFAEGKNRVTKVEEDNAKLRRALEHSMTRLNRMSVDSDFLVDSYHDFPNFDFLASHYPSPPNPPDRLTFEAHFDQVIGNLLPEKSQQRGKQRIGLAQQGEAKGVVRGVFDLPGRLVGGILGSASSETSSNTASENQSFADLWVDFLLRENEGREKRESDGNSQGDQNKGSPPLSTSGPQPNQNSIAHAPNFSRSSIPFVHQNQDTLPSHGTILQSETMDSEFLAVPLSLI